MLRTRKRARRTGRKGHEVQREGPSASEHSSVGTPEDKVTEVDVEEVRARLRHVSVTDTSCRGYRGVSSTVSGGKTMPIYSPRARQKGTLTRKKLFTAATESVPWSNDEEKGLVTFVLLHSEANKWPSRKDDTAFWMGAGEFVQSYVKSDHCRTGLYTVLHAYYMYGYSHAVLMNNRWSL